MRKPASITVLLSFLPLLLVTPPMQAASASAVPAAIAWTPCAEDSVVECGTLTVPLDYTRPDGRTLSIAVSRLPAADPDRRRGVLLLNWGGPGWSGRQLPSYLAGSRAAELAKHFDLIGFDARGTGSSTGFACDSPESIPPDPDLSDKERAAREAAAYGAAISRCGNQDPTFARSLTTQNIARDMDRIRTALGESRISYLGVSWGTALGATFRTMFADRVDRMLLDSVTDPTLSRNGADLVPGMEQSFHTYSAWLARRNGAYHLGDQPAQVRSRLLALRDKLQSEPFEIDGGKITGGDFTALATQSSDIWPLTARLIAGIAAGDRSAVADAIPDFSNATRWPSAEFGERYNAKMGLATSCNLDTTPRDFEQVWAIHERLVRQFPMAGPMSPRYSECTGWPHQAQPLVQERRPGSLQLMAHTFEWNTPAGWGGEMQQAIGGALGYVDDDVHGSLVETSCAKYAVRYLVSGKTFFRHCQPD